METLTNIFNQILPVLVSFAVPILTVLAIHLVKKISNKLHIETQSALNDTLLNFVAQGVMYAEQYAAKKAEEQKNIRGQEKLYLAVNFVLEELNKNKIVGVTQNEIMKKIESYLGVATYGENHLSGPAIITEMPDQNDDNQG